MWVHSDWVGKRVLLGTEEMRSQHRLCPEAGSAWRSPERHPGGTLVTAWHQPPVFLPEGGVFIRQPLPHSHKGLHPGVFIPQVCFAPGDSQEGPQTTPQELTPGIWASVRKG